MILFLFAFLGGLVTVLSPCILPVLPIVLSGSLSGGHRRPIGIVVGFVLSFTLFTLFISTIVKATGISSDALRTISIAVIFLFGISLLVPGFQALMERLFTKIAGAFSSRNTQGAGFFSGIALGLSLGLVWTPCVGPIIASVITLAAANSVSGAAVLITFSYATGTAIPMLLITFGGRALLRKIPWLLKNTGGIQKAFGILMIVTAIAMFFGLDRTFQTYITNTFPQYGAGLIKIEDNKAVKDSLKGLKTPSIDQQMLGKPVDMNTYPAAPEFIPGGKWFNSEPLTISQLKGKVVLVDFWTYTCINCIRTLPYIKSWNEKYKDKGLVIIGVHTPEFEFEKNADNVEKALKDFQITYPVMQDNNYDTWNAYENQYWPAKYLIDKNGKVRMTHFGEGNYDETEKQIQDLLKETGATVNEKVDNKEYTIETLSPETYLGYDRLGNFASKEGAKLDTDVTYSLPDKLNFNAFAYEGKWNIGKSTAMPFTNSLLAYHFNAKDVYLVINSKNGNSKIKVLLDGLALPQNEEGVDVKDGEVAVSENRLYHLLHFQKAEEHVLQLIFLDDNSMVFAFTFG